MILLPSKQYPPSHPPPPSPSPFPPPLPLPPLSTHRKGTLYSVHVQSPNKSWQLPSGLCSVEFEVVVGITFVGPVVVGITFVGPVGTGTGQHRFGHAHLVFMVNIYEVE